MGTMTVARQPLAAGLTVLVGTVAAGVWWLRRYLLRTLALEGAAALDYIVAQLTFD